MDRLAKLQLIGPVVLAATIVAAEFAADALAAKPSSMIAWYLNIEIFGFLQRSHYVLSNALGLPYLQLLLVAIPIIMLCGLGLLGRRRLLISVATHLSFVYACFVAYTWFLVGTPSMQAALVGQSQSASVLSLSLSNLPAGPQLAVMLMLLLTSLTSFAGSHLHYLRAVRKG